MWFGIVSLFPAMFDALEHGITGRAKQNGLIQVSCWNPRDFTTDNYHQVDDRPYGGGPGMVMAIQPLRDAIQAARRAAPEDSTLVWLTPQGKRFDQQAAKDFSARKGLIFVAGRYEGMDARLPLIEPGEEWSVGDFILSGGELAAMTMIDAVTRLLPGALRHNASAGQDSLENGLLEYPQYTRPAVWKNLDVPDVLLKGDHQAIERWRLKQALGQTWLRRPDLLAEKECSSHEKELLAEFIREHEADKGQV